jgi:glycosyltransferase involved in cell wall biosynthesis
MPKGAAPKAALISLFLPKLAAGGAERVLIAISEEITKRGYRCDLVTAAAGGRWDQRVPSGVRHIVLGYSKPLHAVPGLARYLRRERPAALLSSVFAANVAALLACELSGTGVRCVLSEAYRAEEDAKTTSMATRLANQFAIGHLYRRAAAIIALSEGLGRHIHQVAGIDEKRLFVIPNPSLPGTQKVVESPPVRDPQLLVACGRLEPQKDFATLLRAVAIIRQHHAYRLVVLGEGSEMSMLRNLAAELDIENAVDFKGYSASPEAWMQRATVFVSTSRIEGFPNVLLEALDNGCRIVSTNSSDAVGEILDSGRLGAIVPVGNPSAVAAAIISAFASPSAPHVPYQRYDLQRIVDRYLEVLMHPDRPLTSHVNSAGGSFGP